MWAFTSQASLSTMSAYASFNWILPVLAAFTSVRQTVIRVVHFFECSIAAFAHKMRIFKYLGNFCIILLAFTLTVSAKNRKAEGFWKDGRDAELRKEYDKALELYEK